jgi:hypothetical protein
MNSLKRKKEGLVMTLYRILNVVIVFGILSLSSTSFAYRPLLTEDAAVGALLEEALETSWIMIDEDDGKYSQNMLNAFIIGLGRAELMFEVPYTFNGPDKGLRGILVGAKLIMVGANEKTGLLTAKVEYSTTGIVVAAPEGVVGISAIGTKEFGPVWLHAQVGWFNNFDLNGVFGGLAADYMVLKWMSIVGEVTFEYNSNEAPTRALLGLIFKPTNWLAIDTAATKGITSDAAMWSLQAGLTFIFPQPKLRAVEDDKKFERRKESRQGD